MQTLLLVVFYSESYKLKELNFSGLPLVIHTYFHHGCLLQIAFGSVWRLKEINVTCTHVTGEERRRYFQNKDDIGYAISEYYLAQRSPGD